MERVQIEAPSTVRVRYSAFMVKVSVSVRVGVRVRVSARVGVRVRVRVRARARARVESSPASMVNITACHKLDVAVSAIDA